MNRITPVNATACACTPAANNSIWWRIAAGAFIAGNTMTAALAINVSEASAIERLTVQGVILVGTLLVAVLLGAPLVRETAASLVRREIKIEALFVLSWIGAISASTLSMVRERGPVFFEVASILLVVYTLGRELGRYSTQKALQSASEWSPFEHDALLISEDGGVHVTPVAHVQPGDQVRVHPGRMVPVDGCVVRGRAFVHQADLTGESFAVSLGAGDAILAGSHVLDATLDVEASVAGTERTVDRIAAVLEACRRSPSEWQLLANKVMHWFLPTLVLICGGTWWFWFVHEGWATALFNTMAVLLVACPCVLGFATPLAVWTGIGKLASAGLLVKNGAAMEKLAGVDTVVFDKTGTLTLLDNPVPCIAFETGSSVNPQLVRELIAATEQNSDHPVAQALRSLSDSSGGWLATNLTILPGAGVKACVRRPDSTESYDVRIGTGPGAGDTDIRVWVDNVLVATIHLEESICPNVAGAVDELKTLGVRSILLTGDRRERAERVPVAEQWTSLTPDAKCRHIDRLTRQGHHVLFVGDGTNDAAAMARSTVSIAISNGSPLAMDVASIVWTRQSLAALPEAIRDCREIFQMIRTNVLLALAYNVVGIALAAAGLLHPVAATLLMLCSSSAVTWRSLRLLPTRLDNTPLAHTV